MVGSGAGLRPQLHRFLWPEGHLETASSPWVSLRAQKVLWWILVSFAGVDVIHPLPSLTDAWCCAFIVLWIALEHAGECWEFLVPGRGLAIFTATILLADRADTNRDIAVDYDLGRIPVNDVVDVSLPTDALDHGSGSRRSVDAVSAPKSRRVPGSHVFGGTRFTSSVTAFRFLRLSPCSESVGDTDPDILGVDTRARHGCRLRAPDALARPRTDPRI